MRRPAADGINFSGAHPPLPPWSLAAACPPRPASGRFAPRRLGVGGVGRPPLARCRGGRWLGAGCGSPRPPRPRPPRKRPAAAPRRLRRCAWGTGRLPLAGVCAAPASGRGTAPPLTTAGAETPASPSGALRPRPLRSCSCGGTRDKVRVPPAAAGGNTSRPNPSRVRPGARRP